eukprot:1638293-Pyramimonas_sp.AAC.1
MQEFELTVVYRRLLEQDEQGREQMDKELYTEKRVLHGARKGSNGARKGFIRNLARIGRGFIDQV